MRQSLKDRHLSFQWYERNAAPNNILYLLLPWLSYVYRLYQLKENHVQRHDTLYELNLA